MTERQAPGREPVGGWATERRVAEKEAGGHPRHALAPLLTAPVRLSVMAALVAAEKAEFAFVRDLVEISDSVLSKQLAALEEAGWLEVRKVRAGRRVRTWVSLTGEGREAYARHLAALRAITGGG
ncbi:winged helix-turn-helix domain-containing protein [Streptomyces pyxinae]|nr:transcriptional regulator [Streptomyces sp. LP05-1]